MSASMRLAWVHSCTATRAGLGAHTMPSSEGSRSRAQWLTDWPRLSMRSTDRLATSPRLSAPAARMPASCFLATTAGRGFSSATSSAPSCALVAPTSSPAVLLSCSAAAEAFAASSAAVVLAVLHRVVSGAWPRSRAALRPAEVGVPAAARSRAGGSSASRAPTSRCSPSASWARTRFTLFAAAFATSSNSSRARRPPCASKDWSNPRTCFPPGSRLRPTPHTAPCGASSSSAACRPSASRRASASVARRRVLPPSVTRPPWAARTA
mmetsp:Transcript_15229/g.45965  ORF Transcript_15229/g.45965 Transcript_15229/m.45965 type:complete len:267 (-) Transcript_15229:492-1292(-)